MKSYFELLEAISGRRLETGGVDGEREAASLAEGVSSGDSRMADPALIATMTATSMSRKAKAKDGSPPGSRPLFPLQQLCLAGGAMTFLRSGRKRPL